MKTLLRNCRMYICILIVLGTGGCSGSSSTSPDSGKIRHGTSSAGRSFTVTNDISASNGATLDIEGESPIHLYGPIVDSNSVQVSEYGTVLIVRWRHETDTKRPVYEAYMFLEAGETSTPLIKGEICSYTPDYTQDTSGKLNITYSHGRFTISESFRTKTTYDKCYADEKWLQREFGIDDGQVELLTCAEHYRTRTVAMGENGCPDFSVNDAPWKKMNWTDALWKERCPALRQFPYPQS